MRISKIRIKNYRSIKDSGDILLDSNMFVLAGQNESGKSSILEALHSFEENDSSRESLNFELQNNNELIQEISVTYTDIDSDFINALISELKELIINEFDQDTQPDIETVLKPDVIKKIDSFTVTKFFDFQNSEEGETHFSINEQVINLIKGSINQYSVEVSDVEEKTSKEKRCYLDVDSHLEYIIDLFVTNTLQIVLFNDFQNILPDSILLDDLNKKDIEGSLAVSNLEKLLNRTFKEISSKNTASKNSLAEEESTTLSASFQEDWQQKIYGNNKVNIKFFIENNNEGKKEISFYIETKDGEFIEPRKRSKGMMWFLALWLELKAKESDEKMFLMFDEPGLHLHVKANKDMLSVFRKLEKKGHQIIYSTHSPSLIDTGHLNEIGLVINHAKTGTIVEGLTTSKINSANKRDALQPISEAMGMEPLKDFSVLKHKNVLLEGLSDFWYLKGMSKLINKKIDYEFIPSVGIKGNKIFPLISFCVGYGLKWLLIMDSGPNPQKTFNEIKNELFSGNEETAKTRIFLHSETEIENLFDIKDFLLVDEKLNINNNKKPDEIIGKSRKSTFSKMFYAKVVSGEIKKKDIQEQTIKNFKEIFAWVDKNF